MKPEQSKPPESRPEAAGPEIIQERTVTPAPHTVWLALGSNLGDRLSYLLEGIRCLGAGGRKKGLELTALSGIYETEPVGYLDQPRFYNMTVKGVTELTPFEVLELCQKAEEQARRLRLIRWGPRTLDVDVLLYDELRLGTQKLILPHPRMGERAFVLLPLAEMDPRALEKWGFPFPDGENQGIRLKFSAADVNILLTKKPEEQ
ncbi:MAG: 2-amino-4-hydroxy-6-hydroxymethyldihydropteridine diphosphokinase [Peptococcaceae bacterium]|nr:2-amino-4-hydroxy-6-hydroxymethyldihydropteridine diphosphokinase [Peptococcaceae bacterium]